MTLEHVSPFLIPIVVIIFGIAIAGWAIYWHHIKDMALIEKGLYPQKEDDKSKGAQSTSPAKMEVTKKVLGWGLVLTGFGVALVISAFWTGKPETGTAGLVFGFIGVALLIFFAVIRKRTTP